MKFIIYLIILGFGILWFKWKIHEVNKSYIPYRNKLRGDVGEKVIIAILSRLGDDYKVYHDVRVGKAQIDHMVINGDMCFVIETKLWKGKIVGGRLDNKWKQVLGRKEYWYRNPIKQNAFHIKELVGSGKCSGCEFINIVVCVGNKNVPKLKGVISDRELYNYVVNYSHCLK